MTARSSKPRLMLLAGKDAQDLEAIARMFQAITGREMSNEDREATAAYLASSEDLEPAPRRS